MKNKASAPTGPDCSATPCIIGSGTGSGRTCEARCVGRFLGAVVIGMILSVAISGAIWLLVFIWSSIGRLLLP